MSKFHGQLSLVYKKVYNFRFLADPSPRRVFKGNFVGFVILWFIVKCEEDYYYYRLPNIAFHGCIYTHLPIFHVTQTVSSGRIR